MNARRLFNGLATTSLLLPALLIASPATRQAAEPLTALSANHLFVAEYTDGLASHRQTGPTEGPVTRLWGFSGLSGSVIRNHPAAPPSGPVVQDPGADAADVEPVGDIGGAPVVVVLEGDYAYVGTGSRVMIVDLSNPSLSTAEGRTASFPGVADASDPGAPSDPVDQDPSADAQDVEPVGSIGGAPVVVVVEGDHAYIGTGSRVIIVDLSSPSVSTAEGKTAPFPGVVDVSDPAVPLEVGAHDTPGFARGMALDESRASLESMKLSADRPYQAAPPASQGIAEPILTITPAHSPGPAATYPPQNGGFEADWGESESHRVLVFPADGDPYEKDVGNIFTPPGWLTWFYHEPGTWDQPEVSDAWKSVDPRRVRSGEKGIKLFTSYRKHDAGFLRQVGVKPGTQLRLNAFAHAWSNSQEGSLPSDPRWSEGPGHECGFLLEGQAPNSDWENFTFWIGIDPTGGIDPYADTVVWGDGAHIYNCYHQVPSVEAVAQSHKVTLFLRSRTLWPFKHNDAYWDDAELVAISGAGRAWGYPVVEEGSKIGVHSIRSNNVGGFAQALLDGGTRFPVVKAVDVLGWLPGIKEASPETIIVARLTSSIEGAPKVEDPATDLDEMARALMSFILNKTALDPGLRRVVDYWEVVNEPDPPGTQGYRRLAELMIRCMEEAEAYGLKLALFSLNAGTPEWDEMQAMVATGVFSRARQGGHILALHEGTFSSHDPWEGWGSTLPGAPPQIPGAGTLNFRYRYLYYLLEQRQELVPLVVSEWYCGDEHSASERTLVNALTWYDDQASRDDYFWATCPFTLGPTEQWRHTDYERVYAGGLVEYMIAVKDRQNLAPPVQSPTDSLPLVLHPGPPIPETPTLDAIISPEGDGSYTIGWSTVSQATSYVLQEAVKTNAPTEGDFSPVYTGPSTSRVISGRGAGRYHYRVKARNSWGESACSNVEWVDVLWEAEPNGQDEDVRQANGPLVSGKTYRGYPDDQDDYYAFELSSQATVNVLVEQFAPTSSNGTINLYGPAVGDDRGEPIDYYGEPGHSSMSLGPHSLGPGKYYVHVCTAESHSTKQAYHLTVTY